MRATWEPAAARIAASAPQIAAALSVLADSLVRLNASATEATAGCLSNKQAMECDAEITRSADRMMWVAGGCPAKSA
jgi:hypothetical protein